MIKNITLSAEERMIQKAREKAQRQRTTLNALFREWLARYINRQAAGSEYGELMERLSYARPGRHFSREEMNER